MDTRVGFGPRALAALVDLIIVSTVGLFLGSVIGGLVGLGTGAVAGAAADDNAVGVAAVAGVIGGLVAGFLVVMLVSVLYGLVEAFTGASPGKMLLKLKVGTDDGRQAPVATYLTRWAVKNSAAILSALGGLTGIGLLGTLGSLAGVAIFVGCFLVLGDSRQSLHDLAAKTAVFYKADLG